MDQNKNKIFSARVSKTEGIAQGVKKITFETNDVFQHTAGQYIWVEILEMKLHDPKGSRRAFTIFNIPKNNHTIEIIVRTSESGYKQNLFDLKKGEEVRIHGPFGNSFIINKTHQPKQIIMIAGGTGISVFMPILKTIHNQSLKSKCFLLYLNNTPETTPFLEELKEMKKKYTSFDYKVSYEMFSWDDVKNVSQNMKTNREWWISGPQAMVDKAFEELQSKGVSRANMIFENFYPTHKENLTPELVNTQLNADNLFAKAIQNSTNHTIITDSNGIILFANTAVQETTGYSQAEILGNTPRLWGGMMSHEFYINFWKKKSSGKPFEGEITNRRKNGEIYYAIAHIDPIFSRKKNIIGYIGTEEDITEIKKQENIIQENEHRLKLALEGNRDGIWDWNILTNEVYFSPRWKEMIGYSDDEIEGSVEEWEKRVHPDDIKEVEKNLNSHIEGKTPFYESEHRVLCKNGKYLWILDRGKATERDESGRATHMIGTHTDISESKEKEHELERMNKIMIDRELKMIELKARIKELESQK